jgi:prolyl 4-hydroxylase
LHGRSASPTPAGVDPQVAARDVEQRAAAGDAEAMFALANWRLFALHGLRDLKAAHHLLRKAAGAGHVEAARTRAHLIANGTGCTADPQEARRLMAKLAARDAYAAAQLDTLRRVAEPAKPVREIVSKDPDIIMVCGLLAAEECRYIVALAEPLLQPSFVIDPNTGGRMPHPVRTSYGSAIGPTQEDLVINRINRRLAAATGTKYAWGEPLHILRYTGGQEYKPHLDAIPGLANQRQWTALAYLSDDYKGGETDFPDLGITIRGAPGDVLLFRNTLADGRADPRTRHTGLPVTSGSKWLATRWIRQAPYHPWRDE